MRTAPPLRPRAEALAGRLPALLVAAERVSASVSSGVHGRRRAGPGETFWQFRHHQPGDAVAAIDWRQTAKGDAPFIRETEWEAAGSVFLWRDRSASMNYRSAPAGETKRERADLLLLALAFLLARGGERAALLGGGHPPTGGRGMPARLAAEMEGESGLSSALPPPTRPPRHARVVLIGDFLTDPDAFAATLAALSGQEARGHAVRIADPAEESFPFEGRIRFRDAEAFDETLIGRAESVRETYLARAAAHDAALAGAARARGWTYLRHRTDRPPEAALLALHQAMAGGRRAT